MLSPARHRAGPSTSPPVGARSWLPDETLLELYRTLRRPKLARYFSRAEQEIFLATLAREAILVEVTERLMLCRDPRDDRFLELAAAGNANHLVSGDRDLLTLDPFRGTRIVTPAALLEELGREL